MNTIKPSQDKTVEKKHEHNFEKKYVKNPILMQFDEYIICSKCGETKGFIYPETTGRTFKNKI